MLYYFLRLLMRAATWLAYRRIVRRHLERLEHGRATLILANHTATFMDAMLMGVLLKRRVHFFTRGDYFTNPFVARILRSLGMLPVYRASEGKENIHRNEGTNSEALQVLERGGAVLIFAEGKSALAKQLKPLKKGPFRLAALAAAQGVAPVISPVGINYITPATLRGDVFVAAGEGIDTATLIDGSEARLATHAMRLTETALRQVVWDAADAGKAALADDMLADRQRSRGRFSFEDAMDLMADINSGAVVERSGTGRPGVMQWLAAIVLSPAAGAGFGFHYLPVKLAAVVAKRMSREPDFYAPVLLGAAVVALVAWYIIWATALTIFRKMALPVLLLAAFCGVVYQKWWRYWVGLV